VETTGNVTLCPLEARCGRAKVALPKDKVESFVEPKAPDPTAGGAFGALTGGGGEYLPSGTAMFAGKQRVGTLAAERAPISGTKCLDVYPYFDQPFLAGARSTGETAKVHVCAAASTKLVQRKGVGSLADVSPLPDLKNANLAGNVLVWGDADWYMDTKLTIAKHVQFSDPERSSRRGIVNYAIPAKVIGTAGELVEVELLKTSDCAWVRASTGALSNVRLFIRRVELAPVLARPFTATFKNGSRIALAAGVAVGPTIDGYRISIRGTEMSVPIPRAAIAYSYQPPKLKPQRDDEAKERFFIDGPAHLGDSELVTKLSTAKITKRGDSVLFPLSAPCIDAVLVAPKEAVSSNTLGFGTSGPGVVAGKPSQEHWYIAKGTALLSPAGRAVAHAAEDIDVR
jgi:hypothetical protein